MRKTSLVNLLLVVTALLVVSGFALSVRLEASPDRVSVLHADGITCGNCTARITRFLEAESGVAAVSVDAAAGRVVVSYDSKAVTPETLIHLVVSAGHGCRILQTQSYEEYRKASGGTVPVRQARCWCGMNRY